MTDPAPLEPGSELVVTKRRALMRGLGWPLLALGLVIAVLAALLVIVLVKGAGRDDVIGELACQVQQLGGEPVAGVSCPPTPHPAPHASPRPGSSPRAAASSSPVRIVVVLPDGSTHTVVASPAPARSPAARPPSSPRPASSSSPRATPSPSPVVQICLPSVPCLPPHRSPRRRSL